MRMLNWLFSLPKWAAMGLITLYRSTAPVRPKMCRYSPTCSEYALECISRKGIYVGLALSVRRILRCNPFSPGGYDPVPD